MRPGKPNKAASGFFSNIIREPLAGQEAVLPVSDDVRHWHASPRSAVGFLLHAATIDLDAIGPRRNLTMPGLSVHRRRADRGAAQGRRRQGRGAHPARARPAIIGIVAGWPRNFDTERALEARLQGREDFEEIIRVHIEDELGGKIAA